ncbi:hypothetical protein [Aneurinibacillus tyrosinisolvens]|uniref:hypothetical protein n=1 Tax=Aneurinibacillus tyrosinisolvens TaxID=1443435 RepID=UPI00063FBB7D|nr:hypothetical protein [Aneurinibacillus tyrosinisolvens]
MISIRVDNACDMKVLISKSLNEGFHIILLEKGKEAEAFLQIQHLNPDIIILESSGEMEETLKFLHQLGEIECESKVIIRSKRINSEEIKKLLTGTSKN